MVLWVGIDDTDSLRGMCTTFLASEIVADLTKDYDLIGYPRLVRLNPNIPWKTRGNGAVCVRFGEGIGAPTRIGELGGREIRKYRRGGGIVDPREILSRACAILERWAALSDPDTNPGIVALKSRPPRTLYRRAVQEIVPLETVLDWLPGKGLWKGYKNARGLIGAAAATAWRPTDRTYELLAFRRPEVWGSRRQLDASSVLAMDDAFPSTFNNVERSEVRVAIAPHSPCPVLLGIRGEDALELENALRRLVVEKPSGWFVVETNQGTDDHIRVDDWRFLPRSSTSVSVRVSGMPRTLSGGHTIVPATGRGPIDLAFYEPSKWFRRAGRSLRPGDRVRVWGSVRSDGRSLNVEKMKVQSLAVSRVRVANPVCPACGKSMKSIGSGRGFRCVRRHARAAAEAGRWIVLPRDLSPGWYEPPVFSRRHLAKPTKRFAAPRARSSRPRPSESP